MVLKKVAIAGVALSAIALVSPAHAEEYPPQPKAEESCPVTPPVIQTVYVYRTLIEYRNQMVYVPGPTVTAPPVVITHTVSAPSPIVYVTTPPAPAHEVIHTVYRTQSVAVDKAETIIALAKAQYLAKAYKKAYLAMRAKFLKKAKK